MWKWKGCEEITTYRWADCLCTQAGEPGTKIDRFRTALGVEARIKESIIRFFRISALISQLLAVKKRSELQNIILMTNLDISCWVTIFSD